MPEIVDSRDVLDPNGKTRCAFQGRVLGHFRRLGPNAWDSYAFVSQPGGVMEVLPGIRIQLEEEGAVFRMRLNGRVIRVEWLPQPPGEIDERRRRFAKRCVTDFHNKPGMGPSAFIQAQLENGGTE